MVGEIFEGLGAIFDIATSGMGGGGSSSGGGGNRNNGPDPVLSAIGAVLIVIVGGAMGIGYLVSNHQEKVAAEKAKVEADKANAEAKALLSEIKVKEVECVKANILTTRGRAEYFVPVDLIKYAQHEDKLDANKVAAKSGMEANSHQVVCVLEPVDSSRNAPLMFRSNTAELANLKSVMASCPSQDLGDKIMRKLGKETRQAIGSFFNGVLSK